ncbi:hypothetical protein OHS18_38505 [Amycolatopsis sp. NBC_00355]|uniref:hypothetical protein n=1 Tax=Amycolatopsis sp. NBC_00355 TaxID=2975957 RepID=UPI002E2771D3
MTIAADRDRLLDRPREALDRARRDPACWAEFAYDSAPDEEGRLTDRHRRARFGLLLALQYDRREADLPLLRFVLRQQIVHYRELVKHYLPADFLLAGLLVAEHRQVEDVWLHWEAKELSFDTALGYRDHLLLTPGVAKVREAVARSTAPARDRLLDHITRRPWTDADVDDWLAGQRRNFPGDPAAENLKTWSHHAAGLGDPAASRRFLLAWADGEPRTAGTLHMVQFHLASQGYLAEAIAVQREAVALAEPEERSSKFETLAELQREAADFPGAWESLRTAAAELPTHRRAWLPGLWCQVARECFLLAPLAPGVGEARAAFALGEEVLRAGTCRWMNGAVDAAFTAAEHLGDTELLARVRALRRIADEEQATAITERPATADVDVAGEGQSAAGHSEDD